MPRGANENRLDSAGADCARFAARAEAGRLRLPHNQMDGAPPESAGPIARVGTWRLDRPQTPRQRFDMINGVRVAKTIVSLTHRGDAGGHTP